MRSRNVVFVLSTLLLLVSAAVWGQEITGTISGTVKDATGAVVPGATITVTNTDKNVVVRTAMSSANGEFVAPLLPIGHYSVSAEAKGFKKYVQKDIVLNVNDRLIVNPELAVGGTESVVEVEASPVKVDLQTAAATGLISGTEVRELSINNRNYEQLVALMPGVSSGASDQIYVGTTNPSGQVNIVQFSLNGARSSQNNWTVDGADNVDRGSNLTLLTYPSVDAIAELKVLRGLYSPEFGRSGAGQINVITRSGGNNFHGGLYEFFRNDKLAANTYMNNHQADPTKRIRPPLRYNNFGGTFGGPLYIPGVYNEKRDKTFFFYSEEVRRVITYATFIPSIPTSLERQGIMLVPVCLGGYTAGTSTTQPTCSNILPQGTSFSSFQAVNPIAAAYIKDIYNKMPEPDAITHNLISPQRNVYNHRQELIKIDHVFGPRLQVSGRYLNDSIPTQEPGGLFGPNTYLPGVGTSQTNSPGHSWVFRTTANVTPSLLIEGGYNYSYGAIISRNVGLLNPENSPDVKAALKLPFVSTLERLPSVSGGFSSIAGFGPYDDFNRDHNIFANVSKIAGKHSYRFGVTFHKYQKTENAAGNNAGSFSFNNAMNDGVFGYIDTLAGKPVGTLVSTTKCPSATVYGTLFGAAQPWTCGSLRNAVSLAQTWTNFMLGNVGTFTQASLDLTPDIRAYQLEGFAQDEFRVRSNLTISYGIRYSNFFQPWDKNGRLTNFDPALYNPANAPAIDPKTGNIVVDPVTKLPTKGDPLNGIIIGSQNSPFGKKVANENNLNFAPRVGIAWDPFGDGKISIRTGFGLFFDAVKFGMTEDNIFGNPPFVQTVTINNTRFDDPLAAVPSISAVPRTVRGSPINWKTPYSEQWSFDIQRELPMRTLLDVGYYGSHSVHLMSIVDLNQPLPGAYAASGMTWYPSGTTKPGVTSCVPGVGPACINSTDVGQLNAIRPYLGFGPMRIVEPWFGANYNSLQVAFQKMFTGNSLIKVNYTWSKSLTDGQSDTAVPQNMYDIHGDYGPSLLDRRHIMTANYVYEFPWMKNQQGFVGHFLGGWELSGIVVYQSGQQLNPQASTSLLSNGDPAGQGNIGSSPAGVRPDMIGDPNANAPHTLLQWFNTAAFAEVPVNGLRPGNAKRGAIRGPGMGRWDVSLFKNIKASERLSLQFRAESFNLFNHTNFSSVNTTNFKSSTFGQVTATRDPRIIQLGLKLNF